jgi:hypothetical protein
LVQSLTLLIISPQTCHHYAELNTWTIQFDILIPNTNEIIPQIYGSHDPNMSSINEVNDFTLVKEFRSKMCGQHPGYFKAVFLKKTQIIIEVFMNILCIQCFELWCFMIVIIINLIFCPNIIYFCSVKLDFSISYKESGIKIITINWNIAISCIYEWIKCCPPKKVFMNDWFYLEILFCWGKVN